MLWEEELRESYGLVAEDRREDTTANTPALYVREKGAELWTSLRGGGGAWLSLLMAVVLFIPRLITVIITIITLTTPRSCSCHSPRASCQTPSPAHSSFHHFHPVLFRRSFVCRVVCKPPSSLPRCQIFYRLSVKYEITEAKDIYYIKKKNLDLKKTKKLCEWRPPLKIYLVSDNFSCPLFLSSFLFYLWFFFLLFFCVLLGWDGWG